jgi:hypothetical protein
MPTRITHFLHDSLVTGSQSLGTSFGTGAVHAHDLQANLPDFQREKRNYRGLVEGLHLKLTSPGAPSATKVTVRICADAAGDEVLVPDTEATLVAGVTTATVQAAAFAVRLPLFQALAGPGNGTLYVFAKVDNAGTVPVFTQSTVTWTE